MDHFEYQNNQLFAENVPLEEIAQSYGTPCYVYSRATLTRHYYAFEHALTHPKKLICYAVKANSNLAVLNILARLGSGFDIVSGGELARVLKAGGDPKKVIFSGVGKTKDEIQYALRQGIKCFNVESAPELYRIQEIAKNEKVKAPIAIRVNPDVDAKSHPYISTGLKENKFGVEADEALKLYGLAHNLSNLEIKGAACHIGSQLTSLDPFLEAVDKMSTLIKQLNKIGVTLTHLDLGGGLGVKYKNESPPLPHEYSQALLERLHQHKLIDLEVIFEPGRAIAANAGILLTKVEYLKQTTHKNFCIVDAAMNDLLRPSLYAAWQEIIPVNLTKTNPLNIYDVVGPICETGDYLGKNRKLAVKEGDLLVVRSAGAYGFSMSSNYNSRPKACEVMVDNDQKFLIRKREDWLHLSDLESLLPS